MAMRISSWKILVVAALCLATAACTGGGQSSNSGDDPKTLSYLIEEPENAQTLNALKSHLAEFTRKSGIKIDVKTLPWETMRTLLQTQLRSGQGPDVFSWGSGPSFGGALAKAGLVHDLTGAYQKYHWKVFDFAKKRVTVDGKIWGIPGELETIGLFYNKKIFARLGLQPPRTVAELRAVCAKIKAAGITPLAVSDKEGWEGGHLLSMSLSSEVGSTGMEALFKGSTSWDSADVVRALDLWKQLQNDGDLPDSPTSVDYDSATAQFYSGHAAMIPTGTWLVGEIDDNMNSADVGYIPFPGPDHAGIYAGGLGSGPYINASTPKTDAALKFLNFLASPGNARWTVEHLKTIPPMPVDLKGLHVSPLWSQVLTDTAKITKGGGDFGYNIDVMTTDAFNKAMYDGVQALFTGQQSAQDVAKSLEAAAHE
jgi:raffinose/stachyose/melibiose transport system substrate-binding protein